ncbi:MAG: tetratricopeptide repeat protein [Nannocystaceae bacterium]
MIITTTSAGLENDAATDPEASVRSSERALAVASEARLGEREEALAENGLGVATLGLGDLEGASVHLARAAELLGRALGPDHPDVAKIRNNLAAIRRGAGDPRRPSGSSKRTSAPSRAPSATGTSSSARPS